MWPLAALPASQLKEFVQLLSSPTHSPPFFASLWGFQQLLAQLRFILLCPFVSFLSRLWFTIPASLSLYSTSYMFVFIASPFPSLESPMSFVSLMAVGKIHPAKRSLQGTVQAQAPVEHKWHFASEAALQHRKDFQPISNFLAQFSDPSLLYISCAFIKGKLCALHKARGNTTLFTYFLSAPPCREPLQLTASSSSGHCHSWTSRPSFLSCPSVCDQWAAWGHQHPEDLSWGHRHADLEHHNGSKEPRSPLCSATLTASWWDLRFVFLIF